MDRAKTLAAALKPHPALLLFGCLCFLLATQVPGAIIFTEDFESPDVADYAQGTTPPDWVRANQGYGSGAHGLTDKAAGDFSAPDPNHQAYAFRYTNSGITTVEGVIGDLTFGADYTVTFDVVRDAGRDATPADELSYRAELIAFGDGAARNDCRSTPAGSTVLAFAQGSASATDTSFQTVSFTFTPDAGDVLDLGKDVGIRFKGATKSAIVDNLTVDVVAPAGGDTNPPTPDPLTWASTPTGVNFEIITMAANPATDAETGVVEYLFTNTTTGNDSGWIYQTEWSETGLDPTSSYNYTVKARDISTNQNETGPSAEFGSTTLALNPNQVFYDTFEDPFVSGRPGGSTSVPGWVGSDSRVGLWNEDTGTMVSPYGEQAMWIWAGRNITSTTAGLDLQLQASTTYLLSFNAAAENGSGAINYLAEMLVDGQVVSSVTGGGLTRNFADVSDSLTFSTGLRPPTLGDDVAIRFKYASGDWHYVLGIDNVELFTQPVPENIWDGATDEWQTAHWGTPGATPSDNEAMIVNSGIVNVLQDLSANPALTLQVARDATGGTVNVGDAGNAGKLVVSGGVQVDDGGILNVGNGTLETGDGLFVTAGGDAHVGPAGTVSTTPATGLVDVESGGSLTVDGALNTPSLESAGTTHIAGGTIGTATVTGGASSFTGGTIDVLSLTGGTASVSGGTVGAITADAGILSYSGTNTTNLTVNGGQVHTGAGAAVQNLTVAAGVVDTQGNTLTVGSEAQLGDTKISGDTPFGLEGADLNNPAAQRTLTLNGGNAAVALPPAAPAGATAHYSFDGASLAADVSGNGWDGAVSGSPGTVLGILGNAMSLPGTGNDGIVFNTTSVGGQVLFEDPFSTRTWAFWVDPDSVADNAIVFEEGGGTNGVVFSIGTDGKLNVHMRNDGGNAAGEFLEIASTTNLAAQTDFTHVSVTFDNGTAQLFINGISEGGTPSLAKTEIQNHTSDAAIGTNVNTPATGGSNDFGGYLDEFVVYDRVLTTAEIAQLALRQGPVNLPTTNLTVTAATQLTLYDASALGDVDLQADLTVLGTTQLTVHDLNLADGATLSMPGQALSALGEITIGASPGNAVITASQVSFGDGASLLWDVDATAVTAFDQLTINGALVLGDWQLAIGEVLGMVDPSDTFLVLQATGGITGFTSSPAMLDLSQFIPSPNWAVDISGAELVWNGDDQLLLTGIRSTVVPEPSTLVVLGGVLFSLFPLKQRRTRSREATDPVLKS